MNARSTQRIISGRRSVEVWRRLYLDAAGEDLRGEDRLVRSVNRGRLAVALRVPLHPVC